MTGLACELTSWMLVCGSRSVVLGQRVVRFVASKATAVCAERRVWLGFHGAAHTKNELVGGLVGGIGTAPQLNPEEPKKLKALLNSL